MFEHPACSAAFAIFAPLLLGEVGLNVRLLLIEAFVLDCVLRAGMGGLVGVPEIFYRERLAKDGITVLGIRKDVFCMLVDSADELIGLVYTIG